MRAWKSWSCVVLKPDGLYPTRPAAGGNKPAKLKAIAAALKTCDDVILATDCDREGQLIGQEILEHLGYRGRVRRALFTAQDPKTLRQAFARLKPNAELRPLYEAAVARQQADQIFNLSSPGPRRKRCSRRGSRRDRHRPGQDADARPLSACASWKSATSGPRTISRSSPPRTSQAAAFGCAMRRRRSMRIKDRVRAEAIAKAAAGHQGPLGVSVEHCRQAPPSLFDLPSLQKTCGQRWGWTADRTLVRRAGAL